MSGLSQPPGWYPADGDPPGTVRWWDGGSWVGGPQMQGAQQQSGYIAPGGNVLPTGQELADPWLRVAARMIDTILLLVMMFALMFGIFGAVAVADISDIEVTGTQLIGQFIIFVIGAMYFYLMNSLLGGTVGKLLLGIRIVDEAGEQPIGLGTGFIRTLASIGWIALAVPIVSIFAILGLGIFGIVSLVLLFTDPERRTPMDRMASTFVVKN